LWQRFTLKEEGEENILVYHPYNASGVKYKDLLGEKGRLRGVNAVSRVWVKSHILGEEWCFTESLKFWINYHLDREESSNAV